MVLIENVSLDSTGHELELAVGDALLKVNGQVVEDCLDARFLLADEEVVLEVQKSNGELWELEVSKDLQDDLGLSFEHPPPRSCGNKCIFCFVHQLPRGLRPSLYLMDEDYRFSFLYGAYVTLSNLSEADLQRIIEQQLSPLYVSVHTTNPQLRNRMLGRDVEPVVPIMQRLLAGGIKLHTQIVVCPEWNDGVELQQTITELYALGDGILSLALVPVGLTGHRSRLTRLRVPTAKEARVVVELLPPLQNRFLQERGTRWLFAADEWYLRSGEEFPAYGSYEGFPQLENGVGLIADFRHRARLVLSHIRTRCPVRVTTVTGRSFAGELSRFLANLEAVSKAQVTAVAIDNNMFGGDVSVAGLVSGRDLIEQLKGRPLGEALLIPDVMLKEGTGLFLDDVTLDQVAAELDLPVRAIPSTPSGLWQGIRRLATSTPTLKRNLP
jgi:putative radical SAM enzyme (TIGR03279 family)